MVLCGTGVWYYCVVLVCGNGVCGTGVWYFCVVLPVVFACGIVCGTAVWYCLWYFFVVWYMLCGIMLCGTFAVW